MVTATPGPAATASRRRWCAVEFQQSPRDPAATESRRRWCAFECQRSPRVPTAMHWCCSAECQSAFDNCLRYAVYGSILHYVMSFCNVCLFWRMFFSCRSNVNGKQGKCDLRRKFWQRLARWMVVIFHVSTWVTVLLGTYYPQSQLL